jgi:hypothetical protein
MLFGVDAPANNFTIAPSHQRIPRAQDNHMTFCKTLCKLLALSSCLICCASSKPATFANTAPEVGVPVTPPLSAPAEAPIPERQRVTQNVECADKSPPIYEIFEKTTVLVKCPGEGVKLRIVCRKPPSLTRKEDGGVRVGCS